MSLKALGVGPSCLFQLLEAQARLGLWPHNSSSCLLSHGLSGPLSTPSLLLIVTLSLDLRPTNSGCCHLYP